MLSERENFLRALRGEVPEYVPRYRLNWSIYPSFLRGDRANGVGKDIFGVEWTSEGSAMEAPLPKPGSILLDDIRKWRDVIKYPDFSDVDWEAAAKKDLENFDNNLPRGGGTGGSFFQALVSFMGFEEALVACYVEPDEVKELMNYLCDCYLSLADNMVHYYKPDYISMGDDIAHERSTFVSLETFRDIFAPVWRRYIKHFKDMGYLATHHNCGHFELFVDDLVDMGFDAWDPVQISNDRLGIKKKYADRLMLCCGVDKRRFLPHLDTSEEEIRAIIKDMLDELAPGGRFAIALGTPSRNPVQRQREDWADDEYQKIKWNYYGASRINC